MELFIKSNNLKILNLDSLLIQHVNYKNPPPIPASTTPYPTTSSITEETEITLIDYGEIKTEKKSNEEFENAEQNNEDSAHEKVDDVYDKVLPIDIEGEGEDIIIYEDMRRKRSTTKNDTMPVEITYTEVLVKNAYLNAAEGIVFISLGIHLQEASDYVIQVEFSGNMTSIDNGFLYSEYKDADGGDR